MLIELWRTEPSGPYSMTTCAICGDDFKLGTVYARIVADGGDDLGEMCSACLDHLSRRKSEGERPAVNWPARDWPTLEDLKQARQRHPELMSELDVDGYTDDEYMDAVVLWRMERERV